MLRILYGQNPVDAAAVVTQIADRYRVPEAQVEQDMDALLQSMSLILNDQTGCAPAVKCTSFGFAPAHAAGALRDRAHLPLPEPLLLLLRQRPGARTGGARDVDGAGPDGAGQDRWTGTGADRLLHRRRANPGAKICRSWSPMPAPGPAHQSDHQRPTLRRPGICDAPGWGRVELRPGSLRRARLRRTTRWSPIRALLARTVQGVRNLKAAGVHTHTNTTINTAQHGGAAGTD